MSREGGSGGFKPRIKKKVGGRVGGCEPRIVKMQKNREVRLRGGGGPVGVLGGVGWVGGCEPRIEVIVKMKKSGYPGGGGGGSGVDVNQELKLL